MKFLTTALDDIGHVSHGFFTRQGGVSGGIYDSLNCAFSSSDAPENVAENRKRVLAALGLPESAGFAVLWQVHSPHVVTVTDKVWTRENTPEGDALVTATPNIALGILTADCAPVLFADAENRVVGAAHAGWKGAVGGVLAATVEAMTKLGAKRGNIHAAIGPCIGPQSYEVSDAFRDPFMAQDKDNARFFRGAGKAGHLMFDLPGYVAHSLSQAGIRHIHDTRQDTLPNEAAFFSYRRTTQRAEKDYGRQISMIAIKGE